MKLRPWQQRALMYLLNRTAARACLQAPTGSGKSLVERLYAYERIAAGRRVVLAVPSIEIARQFRAGVLAESTLRPGWDVGDARCYHDAHELIITTHQTFWRRVQRYDAARWDLIFDECHHANAFAPVNVGALEAFPKVVGASASPWSAECVSIFGDRVFVYGLREAIRDQAVSPYQIHVGEPPAELEGKTLRFVGSLDEVDAGGGVHSKLDEDERRRRVRKFVQGGASAGEMRAKRCLLEGFDDGEIRNVVISARSQSEVTLYQMAGRALRFQIGKSANIYIGRYSHRYLLSALAKAQ